MMKKNWFTTLLSMVLSLLFMAAAAIPAAAQSPGKGNPNTGIQVTPLGHDVYLFDDMGVSTSYLIVGQKKCLIIDSGIGNKYFYQEVLKYCGGKPVECALTHAHMDHAGAAKQFPVYYENGKDRNIDYQKDVLIRAFSGYAKTLAMPQNMVKYGNTFGNISDDSNDPNSKCVYISEGWKDDLGGRTVTYYETAGHTSGSGCYYDDLSGYLFVGDMASPEPWLFFSETTDMGTYSSSMNKMYALAQKASNIYTGHEDQGHCTPAHIKALAEVSSDVNQDKLLKAVPAILFVPKFYEDNGQTAFAGIFVATSKIQ